MHLDTSPENLKLVVVSLITLILSISVHEFGHAIVADWLGDRLPRSEGRVTLNPIAHADPIGTLALPLFGLLMHAGGFGWGRPVRTLPASYSRRFSMRTGSLLVAAAGPGMNILFALVISMVLAILIWSGLQLNPFFELGLRNAILLNFVLACFNLIPAPPLDGGAVLAGLLPTRMQHHYDEYAKYGIFVVLAFFLISKLRVVFLWPAYQLYHLWVNGVLGI
jgi:Zn-dependent protease